MAAFAAAQLVLAFSKGCEHLVRQRLRKVNIGPVHSKHKAGQFDCILPQRGGVGAVRHFRPRQWMPKRGFLGGKRVVPRKPVFDTPWTNAVAKIAIVSPPDSAFGKTDATVDLHDVQSLQVVCKYRAVLGAMPASFQVFVASNPGLGTAVPLKASPHVTHVGNAHKYLANETHKSQQRVKTGEGRRRNTERQKYSRK
jgi:hypothetical protein